MGCSNQEVYKGLGPQIVRVEEGPAYLSHPSGVLRLVQQFQAQVIFLVPPFLLRDIGPKNKEEIIWSVRPPYYVQFPDDIEIEEGGEQSYDREVDELLAINLGKALSFKRKSDENALLLLTYDNRAAFEKTEKTLKRRRKEMFTSSGDNVKEVAMVEEASLIMPRSYDSHKLELLVGGGFLNNS